MNPTSADFVIPPALETAKPFGETEMYRILCDMEKIVPTKHNLNRVKNMSPFWKGDERSYNWFLDFVKSEWGEWIERYARGSHSLSPVTRKNGSPFQMVQAELWSLIHKPTWISSGFISPTCAVCMTNPVWVDFVWSCKHISTCIKCLKMLSRGSNGFKCPICRCQQRVRNY
ncbi:hypothetical protein MIV027R [Invertebrate iridescent virus 3]|uniref:Putative RING finger protein 027R n=1 Tax=Invertebrate iridescent virus 3 TaxID=345201 RepID=VF157_IIV3|nr:hypothetical protein MIV027R [Invertebrate iridescent virus 3]Q197D3.1 RecName: Full=Putative RING finger protein 027R [Invertebrate iridescent virus 3]ABF82057.1 hypothetical protein MIV027R [Invertebrate iridescent virus 3]